MVSIYQDPACRDQPKQIRHILPRWSGFIASLAPVHGYEASNAIDHHQLAALENAEPKIQIRGVPKGIGEAAGVQRELAPKQNPRGIV